MGSDDAHLDEVVQLELRLLDPEVRADTAAVSALLHPEFLEFGSSGRVWQAPGVVESLRDDPYVSGSPHNMAAVALADGVVLVTYLMSGEDGSTLRSSVWVLDEESRWRMRFHQGTRR